LGDNGIRKADPCAAGVSNMPGACCLGRGRIHGHLDASCKDVDGCPFSVSVLFIFGGYGIRKINTDVRWTSACRRLDGGNSLIFAIGENANESHYPPLSQIKTIPQSASLTAPFTQGSLKRPAGGESMDNQMHPVGM